MDTVSILLPTLNEEGNIGPLIDQIFALKISCIEEVIVLDDQSEDRTPHIVSELIQKHPKLTLIQRCENPGLVNSLNHGIKKSKGDIVLWMDSDLQMPTSLIPKLISSIINKEFEVAVGSRFVKGGADERSKYTNKSLLNRTHKFLSWAMCSSISFSLSLPIKDISSGYIAIKKSIFNNYKLEGDYAEYFLALVMHLKKENAKVIELPYTLSARESGYSKSQEGGYLGLLKIGSQFIKKIFY